MAAFAGALFAASKEFAGALIPASNVLAGVLFAAPKEFAVMLPPALHELRQRRAIPQSAQNVP